MKRLLLSIAAAASLFSAGCCCCEGLFGCGHGCGRSCCSSPCGSPCGGGCSTGGCSTGGCGTPTYGPAGFAAPVNGTAFAAPAGVPLASNGDYVGGPIVQTAATMPLESLRTY